MCTLEFDHANSDLEKMCYRVLYEVEFKSYESDVDFQRATSTLLNCIHTNLTMGPPVERKNHKRIDVRTHKVAQKRLVAFTLVFELIALNWNKHVSAKPRFQALKSIVREQYTYVSNSFLGGGARSFVKRYAFVMGDTASTVSKPVFVF
jgi:hypothetical protein